ncbi:hypothetical protein EGI26_15250 [Lacihabitans sp. CCS-44]|uniref:erythromycin esterase family protein n=1 Tax=Lacihabitans sp. CCS-44 TaxID=2487331 RepID=UPI0020CFE40D|nr:erythromycin esterase family protein [Lacihabitans sp. CCS-44]MCP9756520.1 hypothetical protein [Lacihabitans sp. CCS-44]
MNYFTTENKQYIYPVKNFLILSTIFFWIVSCKEPANVPSDTTLPPAAIDSSLLVVNELNKLIKPLGSDPLSVTDDELKVFDEYKNVKVIGLGEATHGTKEFFQMKQRLFQYFVKNFGHRVFAFEMDYGESLVLDEYLQTGKGDITSIMKKEMHFFVWRTTEVRDLLEWMKSYNIGKSEDQRLHIYGVDCQYFDTNARILQEKISKIDVNLGQKLQPILSPMKSLSYIPSETDLNTIASLIKSNKNEITGKSSESEYQSIEHLSDVLIQTFIYANEPDHAKAGIIRDEYMGKNAVWLSKQTNFPMSIWAHNFHVSNIVETFTYSRTMGYYITNALQGNYKVIGFSFLKGTVTSKNSLNMQVEYLNVDDALTERFTNVVFGKCSTPNFLFKTKDVFKNPIIRPYIVSRAFFEMGAVYDTQNKPSEKYFLPLFEVNYDYLIHINTSTHSDLL